MMKRDAVYASCSVEGEESRVILEVNYATGSAAGYVPQGRYTKLSGDQLLESRGITDRTSLDRNWLS